MGSSPTERTRSNQAWHRPGGTPWRPPRHALRSVLLASLVIFPPYALARLGAGEVTPLRDLPGLSAASQHRTVRAGYEVYETTAGEDMRVREYVDSSGVVFAVAWSGLVQPDLKLLLGSHYWRYLAEAQRTPGDAKVFSFFSKEVVMQVVRLPRGFVGRAYLPSNLPAGTEAAEFR